MKAPDVTIIQIDEWPRTLTRKEAASYLSISERQLGRLVALYPGELTPFSFLPDGDVMLDRDQLDKFIEKRKLIGVERTG